MTLSSERSMLPGQMRQASTAWAHSPPTPKYPRTPFINNVDAVPEGLPTPITLSSPSGSPSPSRPGTATMRRGTSQSRLPTTQMSIKTINSNGSLTGGMSPMNSMPRGAMMRQMLSDVDEQEDPFSASIRQVCEEHTKQLDSLQKENVELRRQLNVVLQATWAMDEDGWSGGSRSDDEGFPTLHLLSHQKLGYKKKIVDLEVPEGLDKGADKESSRHYDLRDRWSLSEQQMAASSYIGSFAALEDVRDEENKGRRGSRLSLQTDQSGPGATHGPSRLEKLVVHPSSHKLVVWDTLGVFLLTYDLIMVPMRAFDPLDGMFTFLMEWATLGFWTFDMFVACITAYNEKGQVVTNPGMIVRHYLRTWFVLDVVIVVPDWIFTFVELAIRGGDGSAATSTNATRILRAFRFARGIRLLRVTKLSRPVRMVKDSVQSDVVFKVVHTLGIVSLLLFASHVLGSLWYALGNYKQGLEEKNWINSTRIANDSFEHRYFTSYHWAVSHFVLGTTFIQPQNGWESFFATILLVSGMLFFAGFTSNLTVAMITVREDHNGRTQQMSVLRRYLKQHRVSRSLSYRVLRYAEFVARQDQEIMLSEDSVSLIPQLSDGLRTELRFELTFSSLVTHPLFESCSLVGQATIHGLSTSALDHKFYATNEAIFKPSQSATHMYVTESGELSYQHNVLPTKWCTMVEGDWACEAALWVAWVTQGKLVSSSPCKLVICEADAFGEAMKQDAELHLIMAKYARRFVDWINEVGELGEEHTDVMKFSDGRPQAWRFLQDTFDEDTGNRRRSWLGGALYDPAPRKFNGP